MPILRIDHVQLAMPKGQADKAREFYAGPLGIAEVPKPAALAGRGGVWFETGDVKIHLGVESEFRAARKAHPAHEALMTELLRQHRAPRRGWRRKG